MEKEPMESDGAMKIPRQFQTVHDGESCHSIIFIMNTTSPTMTPRRCIVCKGMDAIVYLESCGHAFHSRCILEWPIHACEVCHTPCDAIAIVGRFKTLPTSPSSRTTNMRRSWDDAEREYCMLLMDMFKEGSLPLKHGMHLRQTLALLLNCNPMRITKKFKQQDQLGKQAYIYHPNQTGANYKRHIQRQKQLSTLRDSFYWELKSQCGYAMENMREIETEFWIDQLVSFAAIVGQRIEPYQSPPSTPQLEFKNEVIIDSPSTVECTLEHFPCMSQMEWEVMEDMKQLNTDPLPWSGHSLYDEFDLSNVGEEGRILLDGVAVDDSIWLH